MGKGSVNHWKNRINDIVLCIIVPIDSQYGSGKYKAPRASKKNQKNHSNSVSGTEVFQKYVFYLVTQIDFIGERVPERSESVLDEFFQIRVREFFQMLFQVSPGALRAGPDGHGAAGVKVGGRTGLNDVGAIDVVAYITRKMEKKQCTRSINLIRAAEVLN